MMNVTDLKKMTALELDQQSKTLLRELFDLRMKKGSGQPVALHRLKQLRRGIARIKTISKEKGVDHDA